MDLFEIMNSGKQKECVFYSGGSESSEIPDDD